MLFSGARPNEIAQLRACDVKCSALGTWYLDLMIDEDGKGAPIRVKTQSSRRRIPLHSELLKIGLLNFVQARRATGADDADLFPSLKPDKYGNRAWYALKRLNERFLPDAVALNDRQSLYSLRHNVRDALRTVSAPPEALQAIAGWAAGGKQVSDQYGDPTNPDFYVKWVNAIAYPGLDIGFLHT
jgi:integrase